MSAGLLQPVPGLTVTTMDDSMLTDGASDNFELDMADANSNIGDASEMNDADDYDLTTSFVGGDVDLDMGDGGAEDDGDGVGNNVGEGEDDATMADEQPQPFDIDYSDEEIEDEEIDEAQHVAPASVNEHVDDNGTEIAGSLADDTGATELLAQPDDGDRQHPSAGLDGVVNTAHTDPSPTRPHQLGDEQVASVESQQELAEEGGQVKANAEDDAQGGFFPDLETVDTLGDQGFPNDTASINANENEDFRDNQDEATEHTQDVVEYEDSGLHPARVQFGHSQLYMFPAPGREDFSRPVLTNTDLARGSLGALLQACKEVMNLREEDLLGISFPDLDLQVTEDSADCLDASCSLEKILNFYQILYKSGDNSGSEPEPLTVHLYTQTRFSVRLNQLEDHLCNDGDLSSLQFREPPEGTETESGPGPNDGDYDGQPSEYGQYQDTDGEAGQHLHSNEQQDGAVNDEYDHDENDEYDEGADGNLEVAHDEHSLVAEGEVDQSVTGEYAGEEGSHPEDQNAEYGGNGDGEFDQAPASNSDENFQDGAFVGHDEGAEDDHPGFQEDFSNETLVDTHASDRRGSIRSDITAVGNAEVEEPDTAFVQTEQYNNEGSDNDNAHAASLEEDGALVGAEVVPNPASLEHSIDVKSSQADSGAAAEAFPDISVADDGALDAASTNNGLENKQPSSSSVIHENGTGSALETHMETGDKLFSNDAFDDAFSEINNEIPDDVLDNWPPTEDDAHVAGDAGHILPGTVEDFQGAGLQNVDISQIDGSYTEATAQDFTAKSTVIDDKLDPTVKDANSSPAMKRAFDGSDEETQDSKRTKTTQDESKFLDPVVPSIDSLADEDLIDWDLTPEHTSTMSGPMHPEDEGLFDDLSD